MRHFDVQILGGIAMFHGSIAEMETGEGKTITATLPMYLHSLVGKGSHLATVNDYLAKRDAELMTPIYRALGLTRGHHSDQYDPATIASPPTLPISPTERPRNLALTFSKIDCCCVD